MNQMDIQAEKFNTLDHAPVGLCVIREDYIVLFWNRCLEDWTGIVRSEILRKDISNHFPRLKEPRYKSRLRGVFLGGPPEIFSSQLHKHIFPSTLPNGNCRIQHTTVTAIPAGNGQTHYALFSVEDVTEMTRLLQDFRIMRDQALEEIKQRKRVEVEREKLIDELKVALDEVKLLSGFLPICSSCKNIRDDKGYWNRIENYISKHSEAEFSHSICPECAKKLYPDFQINNEK
jgi:PAS domain S-box-containing protein